MRFLKLIFCLVLCFTTFQWISIEEQLRKFDVEHNIEREIEVKGSEEHDEKEKKSVFSLSVRDYVDLGFRQPRLVETHSSFVQFRTFRKIFLFLGRLVFYS